MAGTDDVRSRHVPVLRERSVALLAPALVEPDDLGNGQEIGDGSVPADQEANARQAEANCPEHAVLLQEIQ